MMLKCDKDSLPLKENVCSFKPTHEPSRHSPGGDRAFGRNITNLFFEGLPETKHELPHAEGGPIKAAIASNPQLCEEYADEIEAYLKTIEGVHQAKPDYIVRQKDINAAMRAILVDWLADVHARFKLAPETLFLTVNLIDGFL